MGHVVTVPNLYEEGVVFDDYEEASKYVESIGSYAALLERTREAARVLPEELVYAGFSNGGGRRSTWRPLARGRLRRSSSARRCRSRWYGQIEGAAIAAWPANVPVQVHYTRDDSFRDEQALIDSFASSVRASGSGFEFHEYPGDGHLFTDKPLPKAVRRSLGCAPLAACGRVPRRSLALAFARIAPDQRKP